MWQWTLGCLLLVVLLIGAAIAFPVWRRHRISSAFGSFDLALNGSDEPGPRGWTLGIARYTEDELQWFAIFGISLRPRYRFRRGDIDVLGRARSPEVREVSALHAGNVIIACQTHVGVRQLALSPSALTGLLAWLEASPPGQQVNNVL